MKYLFPFIGILSKALVPAAVLLVFALARKYLPAASAKAPEQHYSVAELDSRFGNRQWIVGISIAVVGVFFAIGTYAALTRLNRYLSFTDGPAEFRLWQQNAVWWFFPGFGALALSWEIVMQLWSAFGNSQDARLYNYWSIQKMRFDATRLLRWMAVLIVMPIGVATVLALPMHVSLLQDNIRDCGYAFAPCKMYRYADARRMTMVEGFRDRQGNLTRRAGIVLDFSDGRRWSSADIGDFKDTVDPALVEFLKKKTNLPLSYAQTQVDIPALDPEPQRMNR